MDPKPVSPLIFCHAASAGSIDFACRQILETRKSRGRSRLMVIRRRHTEVSCRLKKSMIVWSVRMAISIPARVIPMSRLLSPSLALKPQRPRHHCALPRRSATTAFPNRALRERHGLQRLAASAQVDRAAAAAPKGLTITWLQYGGPGKAVFDETGAIPVGNGQAATTVRFSEPGTYRLRAIANDGALSTTADVIISVK